MLTEGAVLLRRAGLQRVVARRIGLTQQAVSKLANARSLPGPTTRVHLQNELGIPIDAWDLPYQASQLCELCGGPLPSIRSGVKHTERA